MPTKPSAIDDFADLRQPREDSEGVTVEVPIDDQAGELVDGAMVTETEDGVEIDLDPVQMSADPAIDFDANLAMIEGIDADAIAQQIVEAIEEDKNSRSEWAEALADGLKLLGTKKQKMTKPFPNASGVWDPMMAEATVRFWATFHGELLPAKGPVKSEIFGTINEATTQASNRQRDWMNYYFTKGAKEYYPDMDQLGFWLPLAGSMFKKIYQCPIKMRPLAPFIMPEDVIVPYTATSIESTTRLTIVNHMNRRDIKLRQMRGLWKDVQLGQPSPPQSGDTPVKDQTDRMQGITPSSVMTQWRGDEIFDVYEVDLDLDLTQFGEFRGSGPNKMIEGLPLPYKLIIEKETMQALALFRNWRQGDQSFEKKRNIVHYKFLPGVGFYGFGYAHLLGSLATTGTALRRQIIDAITLSMFPGGLKAKGMKMDNNNQLIGPSEFREIDTGGQPINQALTLIPRPELSQIPILALQHNSESARQLASNVEIAIGEGRQDAPVGTTLALMEGANRLTSASLKLAHITLGEEFEIFADIFGRVLPEQPYPFPVQGGESAIMRADFEHSYLIRPVSDPTIVTNTQRIMRAQAIKQSAIEAPNIHDMRQVYRQLYIAMDMDDDEIDLMLPPPPDAFSGDPVSENQMAMQNMPIKAMQHQDHEAHIKSHELMAEMPNMAAHIAEHMGMKFRADIERILGAPLPPLGQQMPPEIEAQISVMVAKAVEVLKQERGQEMTPDKIMMEELKQEWAEINRKIAKDKADAMNKAYAERQRAQTAKAQRDQDWRIELLRAAANTSDNMNPPLDYVKKVLEIGQGVADIDLTVAQAEVTRRPPKDPNKPKPAAKSDA
jgi:hypothetical protein